MGKKIRILLLTTDSRLSGTEKTVLNIARSIDGPEFTPNICTLIGDGGLITAAKDNGIHAESLYMRSKTDLSAFPNFIRFLKKMEFDIVHSFLFHANVIARMAKSFGYIKRLIASERFVDYDRSTMKITANKLLQRYDDLMTCNCAAIRDMLVKREGYETERIRIIYNGIDLDEIKPTLTKNELMGMLGITRKPKIVVMVARFRKEKGHEALIRAVPKVKKKFDSVKFVLVGDGETLPQMKELAVEMGVAKNVIFPGYVINTQDYFNISDVVAHISHDEGLPNVVLEAFAMKKPVVATSVAGAGEIVRDGENGILLPDIDSDIIADAIITLLKDDEKAAQFGEKGYRDVKKSFLKKYMVNNYKSLYREIMKDGL